MKISKKAIIWTVVGTVTAILAGIGYYVYIYTPTINEEDLSNGTTTAGGGLNNPGNIRYGGATNIAYQGEVDNNGADFKWFSSMGYGFRAIIVIYRYYNTYLGKKSLLDMTSTYAPAGDGSNNPTAYATSLAKALGNGIGINDDISGWLQDNTSPNIPVLMGAIAKVEQGSSFNVQSSDLIDAVNLL
jgi:hypothetical protein